MKYNYGLAFVSCKVPQHWQLVFVLESREVKDAPIDISHQDTEDWEHLRKGKLLLTLRWLRVKGHHHFWSHPPSSSQCRHAVL